MSPAGPAKGIIRGQQQHTRDVISLSSIYTGPPTPEGQCILTSPSEKTSRTNSFRSNFYQYTVSMQGQQHRCVLKSFCCGCSLRTGSLIIAILSLLIGLASCGYSLYLGIFGVNEGWMDLVVNAINVIFAIVLIHGIRSEQRKLVIAWVWVTAVSIALSIILGIVFIVMTASIVAAFILFVFSAIQIYAVLVVRSYAFTLDTAEQGTV